MEQKSQILDRTSQIFFCLFFSAILVSIALTFYEIEIQGNYTAFSEEDRIPEPTDFYIDTFEKLDAYAESILK